MDKEYTLIVDIDGTLCPVKKKEEDYGQLVPYKEMVDRLRARGLSCLPPGI